MSLEVTVLSASNLPDVDSKDKGESDPFVVLTFRGRKKKTPCKQDNLNPTWTSKEATFKWLLEDAPLTTEEKLSVKIKDKEDYWINRLLGQVEISLLEARRRGGIAVKRSHNLEDDKHHPIIDATVTLEVKYTPPRGKDKIHIHKAIEEESDADSDVDKDEQDYDEVDAAEEIGARKSRRWNYPKSKRRRVSRKWSSKTKDFQVLIRIIEGCCLPGEDIDPLVRVTVAGQRRETSVQPSTNSPSYNEDLQFYFRQTSETELFDKTILLEVFNARGLLRFNALLAVFKLDVGYVYERKDHSIIRKWIMMCMPEGKEDISFDGEISSTETSARTPRSTAGYLKITAAVQAPGDKLPVGIDAPSRDDKDDDIESNCLVPVGVQRQRKLLVLKVYQVNDLPQMDTGVLMRYKSFISKLFSPAKEEEEHAAEVVDVEGERALVDPYLTFSFGGKEVSTEIWYNSSNPKFKEDLRIPCMFPSMCERLKIQLKDWDQGPGNDDYIGTEFLSLSSISGPGAGFGEGFLPMFGPCFINFYGSPRENHQITDKYDYLNKGIGEGVAYRGRALVELKTLPMHGSLTQPDRKPFAKDDEKKFQPFQKLSNFTLFACFHEATMIVGTDGPVEFELSIGNKGTKFDESVAHSNTSPCNAVFEGSYYKYIPWGGEKPCIWIDCQWEDISFRIETLNILSRMRETLENILESLKKLKDEKKEERPQSRLEDFAKTCGETFTHFKNGIPSQSGERNSLDNEVHKLRLAELEELANDATKLVNADADVIAKIKVYIRRIKSMAVEAQLSMPDVVLWMISGNTRIAYERIPAHDVMYLKSKNNDACGKFCGKVIDLPLKYPPVMKEGEDRFKIPTLVRLEIWLGLAKYQQQWFNRKSGKFNIFAERFENEVKKGKEWVQSTSRNLPHYSDVTGNFVLSKESFTEPDGWSFTDDTWIEPSKEITTIHHPDESLTEYSDQVYEHETRKYPGGEWEEGKPKYVDLDGNETSLSSGPPSGWAVVSTKQEADQKRQYPGGWTMDCNDRAVDHEGWEYAPQRTYLDFGPEEKAYHLSRRRLLVRRRSRVSGKQADRDPTLSDGWEYARSLHAGFHPAEKSNDRVRRKRLLREIYHKEKDGSIKYPIFKVLVNGKKERMEKEKQKEKQSALCILPRMFVIYKEPIKCELWVSIYRARGLLAQDDTGMNDPYVRVAFLHQSKTTKTVVQTLCPTWDQTLIFDEVIYGELLNNPPTVVMELFDRDKRTDDFLGRCILTPKVMSGEDSKSKLRWRKVRRGEQDGGQILTECELFLQVKDGTATPSVRPKEQEGCFLVRDDLKPKTKQKTLEILCWGLRDIKSKKPLRLLKPSVKFECNQETLLSSEISDMRNCPNFSSPMLIWKKLELPSEKLDTFSPSLNIRVFDNTMFGKSLIGVHEIKSLREFEVQCNSEEGKQEGKDHTGDIRQEKAEGAKGKLKGQAGTRPEEQEQSEDHELFDWWSKYYASKELAATEASEEAASSSDKSKQLTEHTQKYIDGGYDTLTIFPSALEDVPQFGGFNDFVRTFTLRKGKTKSAKDEDDTIVGQFKGTFRIFNDPGSHQQSQSKLYLPSRKPVDCVVRVYVVRGIQLQAKDRDGLADPYLIVSLGKKSQGKPSEHKAKTLNPEFRRVFEFREKIPLVKNLKIQVMDYDFPDTDDLIGETEIDLEQRLLSRYHATCGLPKTYFKSGPFQWRDTLTPFELLVKHCNQTGQFLEDLGIGTKEPSNQEIGEHLQTRALQILNRFGLVPEHVETRPLISKVTPDIEQGKLEMWVDIFNFSEEDKEVLSHAKNLIHKDPSSSDSNQVDGTERESRTESAEECSLDKLLKPSVSIDPREPVKYELRVIIWNTIDVELDDKSAFGEKMSDIFVKAWLVDKDEQRTDVHERSLDGSGSFNYRMIFPFEYDLFEKKIVIKEKVHYFGSDVKEVKKLPVLKVQIFDKDRLSASDFLGGLKLTLNELIRPCLHPSCCGTNKDPAKISEKKYKFIDLFSTGSKTGWWACYGACYDGGKKMKGKVQMTLEILKDEEAKAKPAGRGQSSPNQYPTLDKPDRPAHSFLWYTSPFKTFKFIIWRNINKCYLLKILFCIFLALLIFLFVYSIPNYAAKKMVGA